MLAAFPLQGEEGRADLAQRTERALAAALAIPKMQRVTVLSPVVPASAPQHAAVKSDTWFALDLPYVPGQKLRNMLRRADREIAVRQEAWSGGCEELVRRYLTVKRLDPGTRHIFGRVGAYVCSAPSAVLFAARSRDGRLEGIAVGDYSALETAFYMFAFRREDSPPGTADALLHALVREAETRGQSVLNLGLGIDGGIAFFKKKWGARELMPHFETSWSLT